MKLLVLGCKTLREGVLVAAIFFIAGILIILAAQHIVPTLLHMNLVVLLLGFVLLLLAPVILVSTFLLSVLPKAKSKLDKCEH
jgi:hypothetical protein